MVSNSVLKHLKTKHPNPVSGTPKRGQIRKELSNYVLGFADEDQLPNSQLNRVTNSQIQHYVRVIEFCRYASYLGEPQRGIDVEVANWVAVISKLGSVQNVKAVRIAKLNALLWNRLTRPKIPDSAYLSGVETYHLARHVLELAKGTRHKPTGQRKFTDIAYRLDIPKMMEYFVQKDPEFQKDLLLEQRRYLLRELRVERTPFADIEARILLILAKNAEDGEFAAFAEDVLNPDVETPNAYPITPKKLKRQAPLKLYSPRPSPYRTTGK